jgi:serine/threonine protein kinase
MLNEMAAMSTSRPAHIKIGTHEYVLEKTLGKGMFGEVFLGRDIHSNEQVAIKKFIVNKEEFEKPLNAGIELHILQPKRNKIEELKQQGDATKDEVAKLQSELDNFDPAPMAAKYYKSKYPEEAQKVFASAAYENKLLNKAGEGFGEVGAVDSDSFAVDYYVAMKLAKGRDLTAVLKETPPDANELFEIFKQLIDKVENLQNEKGIVLRDLHTNNLMYDRESGQVSIIDFGDALELENGKAVAQAMGSEPFMAHEVFKATALDSENNQVAYSEKTSVFTLGAMMARLFELAGIVQSAAIKDVSPKGKPIYFKTIVLRDSETESSKIADEVVKEEMLNLLKKMTIEDPENRVMSLADVKHEFSNLMDKHLISIQSPEEIDLMQIDLGFIEEDHVAARVLSAPDTHIALGNENQNAVSEKDIPKRPSIKR